MREGLWRPSECRTPNARGSFERDPSTRSPDRSSQPSPYRSVKPLATSAATAGGMASFERLTTASTMALFSVPAKLAPRRGDVVRVRDRSLLRNHPSLGHEISTRLRPPPEAQEARPAEVHQRRFSVSSHGQHALQPGRELFLLVFGAPSLGDFVTTMSGRNFRRTHQLARKRAHADLVPVSTILRRNIKSWRRACATRR